MTRGTLRQDAWTLRPSPTLALVQSTAPGTLSASTPSFRNHGRSFRLPGAVTQQVPADGGRVLQHMARSHLFARWQAPTHGVVVGAGAKAVLFALFRTLLRPGERALIVTPAWPSYVDLVRSVFAEPVAFATTLARRFALAPADIDAALADDPNIRVVVLSNPNNPAGVVYPRADLFDLARRCAAHDVTLVLDESFAGVILRPEAWETTPLAPPPNTCIVNSFSKSFHLQGLRLAAALVPHELTTAVQAAHQTVNGAVATPSVAIAEALEAKLTPLDDGLAARYRALAAWLDDKAVPFLPPDGTFYVFPAFADVEGLRVRLQERGVSLLTGAPFGPGYEAHARLCFQKTPGDFRRLLDTLEAAW